MRPKYKMNINHIDSKHGIHKLERDGFTREQIIATMYKETKGAKQSERTELIQNLYDRAKD